MTRAEPAGQVTNSCPKTVILGVLPLTDMLLCHMNRGTMPKRGR